MAKGDVKRGSDGKPASSVGPWAKDKLFYIGGYCQIFSTGMKRIWKNRVYIDLFAGPGRCLVEGTNEEVDGSPLVAVNCPVPFTHYFFNDANPELIEALKSRIPSTFGPTVKFFNDDANQAIDGLLNELALLPTNQTLDFCFIDPFGWEIRFSSIVRLTQGRRIDLAITFHTGNIKRFAHKPLEELDQFFPDPDWRKDYQSKKAKGAYLLACYKKGLNDLGYSDIQERVLVHNRKGVPLYHLLFASKHPRGKDFWDKISQRGPTGQIRLPL